jgi:signal transduction histidine kinase
MAGTLGLNRVRTAPQHEPVTPRRRALAWGLAAGTAAFLLVGVVLTAVTLDAPAPADFGFRGFQVIIAVPLGAVGLMLSVRRPDSPIGWLLGAAALIAAVQLAAEAYAIYALVEHDGLAGGLFGAWLQNWLWIPLTVLIAVYVPLYFPNGRLPSTSWRWVAILGGVAMVFASAGQALLPGRLENFSTIDNPYALDGLDDALASSPLGGFVLAVVAAAASLVARFRRASGQERQQIKVVAFAGGVMAMAMVFYGMVDSAAGAGEGSGALNRFGQAFTIVALTGVPVAAGVAVLRYGLLGIDVVINKTLVYAALAAFFTLVYAALVAGIGAIIGDRSNVPMSMAAAAVIAVGFQPVRVRAQQFANRLVYGERASPYEVLSSFSARLGETLPQDELLDRMARLLGEGTGAAGAEVRLRVGERFEPAATWGEPGEADDLVVPVLHQGEELGALALTKQRGESVTPADEKLVRDLAGQAGLVLRNAALIADLRASRQRLVAAQDEERRKLERNLHDGAQQQLVALKVQLGLARTVAEREGATQAAGLLAAVVAEADDALNNLRDLARGVYPPLLAAEGLSPALRGQADKATVPTELIVDRVGRYEQEVEATVYFCCLEAMQNIAKYAAADSCHIRVWQNDGELCFTVADDGAGFDASSTAKGAGLQNMADRLDAVGGSFDIDSTPGAGTTVTGRIPVPAN